MLRALAAFPEGFEMVDSCISVALQAYRCLHGVPLGPRRASSPSI